MNTESLQSTGIQVINELSQGFEAGSIQISKTTEATLRQLSCGQKGGGERMKEAVRLIGAQGDLRYCEVHGSINTI